MISYSFARYIRCPVTEITLLQWNILLVKWHFLLCDFMVTNIQYLHNYILIIFIPNNFVLLQSILIWTEPAWNRYIQYFIHVQISIFSPWLHGFAKSLTGSRWSKKWVNGSVLNRKPVGGLHMIPNVLAHFAPPPWSLPKLIEYEVCAREDIHRWQHF